MIQIVFTYFAPMQTQFATSDMDTEYWLRVVIVAY